MKNIIIDTDMGVDDIVAISLLLLSKKFSVRAISTVFGVSNVKQGAINLKRVLSFANQKIPVFKGKFQASKPGWKAKFPPQDCLRANQLTLLTNLSIPKYTGNAGNIGSIDKLYKLVQKQNQKIILVCLGPLTNIAYLANKYQEKFTDKVDRIYLMGGAVKIPGIIPPLNIAEYNIFLDPEAAKTVFNFNIPIVMIPIDAAKFAPAMPELVKNLPTQKLLNNFYSKLNLQQPKNKLGQIIKELILNNQSDFNCFYDPIVAAAMEKPKIIKQFQSGNINVIIQGKNRGQTILTKGRKRNILVVTKINSLKFYCLILSLII